jgi:hypothetical protein
MKSRMPYLTLTCVIVFCLATIAGCKKEGEDLTTNIVGRYTYSAGPGALEIKVTKVNNNTVAVFLDNGFSSSAHGSCSMSSSTAITLSDASGIDNSKNERMDATGTGELKGDTIKISRHEKIYNNVTDVLKFERDTIYWAKRR